MDITINDAAAAALAADILARLDAGSGPAVLKVYDGVKPAGGPSSAITTQTLLSSHTCTDPAGAVAVRRLTFSAIGADLLIDASGFATWARWEDSTGVGVIDVDVGLTGSDAFLTFNIVDWEAGSVASITSAYIDF